jgi:uncharacterized protein (UPF0303 family)
MMGDGHASLEKDLSRLVEQERRLQLEGFGPTEAWALGNLLRGRALAQGGPVVIDISATGSGAVPLRAARQHHRQCRVDQTHA